MKAIKIMVLLPLSCIIFTISLALIEGMFHQLHYPVTESYQPSKEIENEPSYSTIVNVEEITFDDNLMTVNMTSSSNSVNLADRKTLDFASIIISMKNKHVPIQDIFSTRWQIEERMYFSMEIDNPPVTPELNEPAWLKVYDDGCAYLSSSGHSQNRTDIEFTLCNTKCACEYTAEKRDNDFLGFKWLIGGLFNN